MNVLFCSVGRRGELIKNVKSTLDRDSKIIATDCDNTAPALYFADKRYIVPRITDDSYLSTILAICEKKDIHAITTFIDPEIELLARNRALFEAIEVEVLAPYAETAAICFDKFIMFQYLTERQINTVKTYGDFDSFDRNFKSGKCTLPVFVKPRTGSGSVGARKVDTYETVKALCRQSPDLIIQEFMTGDDIDADVYVDTISHQAVSIFTKKKLETTIGGTNKTISFKDPQLFAVIQEVMSHFKFNGPIDMDFFYRDGKYYLSEINPRFGGAYLHAYGCGVNFIKLILNNLNGIENECEIGNYESHVLMMMYDSVVILKQQELAGSLLKVASKVRG